MLNEKLNELQTILENKEHELKKNIHITENKINPCEASNNQSKNLSNQKESEKIQDN